MKTLKFPILALVAFFTLCFGFATAQQKPAESAPPPGPLKMVPFSPLFASQVENIQLRRSLLAQQTALLKTETEKLNADQNALVVSGCGDAKIAQDRCDINIEQKAITEKPAPPTNQPPAPVPSKK